MHAIFWKPSFSSASAAAADLQQTKGNQINNRYKIIQLLNNNNNNKLYLQGNYSIVNVIFPLIANTGHAKIHFGSKF
jgi:hypothetical protein